MIGRNELPLKYPASTLNAHAPGRPAFVTRSINACTGTTYVTCKRNFTKIQYTRYTL